MWQVMLKLNSMSLQLVEQYKLQYRQLLLQQQQQAHVQADAQQASQPDQQQQQGSVSKAAAAPGVSWATAGFLAVSSRSGKRVPGLQLNLNKCTRRQQAKTTAGAAALAAVGTGSSSSPSCGSSAACSSGNRNSSTTSSRSSSGSAGVTVITFSHFLPHPQLPHSRYTELSKAMGCQELQLQMQQVGLVWQVGLFR